MKHLVFHVSIGVLLVLFASKLSASFDYFDKHEGYFKNKEDKKEYDLSLIHI